MTVMSRNVLFAWRSSHTAIRHGGPNVATFVAESVGTEWPRRMWADSWRVSPPRHRAPCAE
eukprot:8399452-Pyramimonas_sp.AAC.1